MNENQSLEPVAVVSHDAGGAEIVSSYCSRNDVKAVFCLAGPALGIFSKKLGSIDNLGLEECLKRSGRLLCSMGWSDHEWQALDRAREAGMHVTVFLDHWTGYESRFIRNGRKRLPDEIWVGDSAAEELARKTFGQIPVKLVPNPYHEDLCDEFNALPPRPGTQAEGIKLLYVCEPTAPATDELKGSGYSENEAIRYFFDCIGRLRVKVDSICFRPHPSEPADKYAWVLDRVTPRVTISENRTLIEDIAANDWIVGRESMALVAACVVGKKTFSCIPPGGKPCSLPFDEILSLDL